MKRKLIFLIVILAVVTMSLSFSIAGCKQEEATEEVEETEEAAEEVEEAAEEATEGEGIKYTLGHENFLQGITPLDWQEVNAKFVCDCLGDIECTGISGGGTPDLAIKAVENMVSMGVDGVQVFGAIGDAFILSCSKVCEEQGVYFAIYDGTFNTEEAKLEAEKNPYFVGGSYTDNSQVGVQIAELALEKGCKTALFVGVPAGQEMHDKRYNGFVSTFEAGGGKLLMEARGDKADEEMMKKITDLVTAYPEVDIIYSTHGDQTIMCADVVKNTPGCDAIVAISDLDPGTIPYLISGDLAFGNGGQVHSTVMTTLLVYNAINGHNFREEGGPSVNIPVNMVLVENSKQAELYKKCFLDNLPYTCEDIRSWSVAHNPDLTLEEFKKATTDNYTMENVMKKSLERGIITQEELDEAGFEF